MKVFKGAETRTDSYGGSLPLCLQADRTLFIQDPHGKHQPID